MLDILQLRISPDEFDRLRLCQTRPPADCHAAFTVKSKGQIWPFAGSVEPAVEERVNVRGWMPLLDKMADEFLIFRPKGGRFFVTREGASYPAGQGSDRRVLFLELEVNRLTVVPPRHADARRVYSVH